MGTVAGVHARGRDALLAWTADRLNDPFTVSSIHSYAPRCGEELVMRMSSEADRIPTWTERHGLKMLGAIMVTMLATVIVAQVGC